MKTFQVVLSFFLALLCRYEVKCCVEYTCFITNADLKLWNAQTNSVTTVLSKRNVNSLGSCAIDPVTTNIYYRDSTIWMVHLDGTNAVQIINSAKDDLGDLSIDSVNRQIYYTIGTQIYRANLDGTNSQFIYDPDHGSYKGLFIDEANGYLYISSANSGQGIYRLTLSNLQLDTVDANQESHQVTVDPNGNVYAVRFDQTWKYVPTGPASWSKQAYQGVGEDGISENSVTGDVFVTSYAQGEIWRIMPGGTGNSLIYSSGDQPWGINTQCINPPVQTTQNPTTQNPTTQNPTTKNPTTQNPTTQNPTTQNPTTQNPITCVADGTYRTQSDGDWGDKCSENFATGCYRDLWFPTCFPNGLKVGCDCKKRVSVCGFNMQFNSSSAISNYLPQLGEPSSLDQNYFNPSNPPPISTSSGVFGGQVTALALSIGFSSCDPNFHTACQNLQDLYVCDNRCESCKKNSNSCKRNTQVQCTFVQSRSEMSKRNNDGKSQYPNCEAFYGAKINDIFTAANEVLGGCASSCSKKRNNCSQCKKDEITRNQNCCVDQSSEPYCDPVVLNDCVTLINQAFIFGKTLNDVDSGRLFSEVPCPS